MRKLTFFLYLGLLTLSANLLGAQPILVNAPLGGETYWEGTDQTILIKSRVKLVKVEISRDGGNTYTTLGVINNRAKDKNQRGRFIWTVTGDPSTNCLLRFSGSLTKKKAASIVSRRFVILNKEFLQGDVGVQGPIGLTGTQGPTGAKGDKGDIGLTGAKGDTGAAGIKGDTGATGAQGPQGIAGPQGQQGVAGLDGLDGSMGPQGLQGLQGPAGPQGPQGTAGANGADGVDGVQGPAGPQGLAGPAGPAGPQGIAGNDGAQGPAGPAGAQGNDGAAGPQGPQGVAGPAGPTGSQGPAGPAGPQGPAGSQGPQGPNGPTVSYINTASTSNAVLDNSRHSGTLMIHDPNIRGPNNVKGRSQIFISFSTASATAGVVSLSCSGLADGSVTINISTQNYAISSNDSIDYQIINAQ